MEEFATVEEPSAADRTANMAIQSYIQDSKSATEKGMEWTSMPELPLKTEILDLETIQSNQLLLRPNQISSPWQSSQEYLETHYKLLREDTIGPLRDAVATFRSNPEMKDQKDFSVYGKVHITRVILAESNIAFRIRFSTEHAKKKILWKYSPRLITGTLVALSPVRNCFQTKCVLAVVASRIMDIVDKHPPHIDIYFADPKDIEIDTQKEWVMIESQMSYFEASRHTLTALQKLSKETFPLSKHICQLDRNVPVSQDVQDHPFLDLQCLTGNSPGQSSSYNVLTELPQTPLGHLNDGQWQALKEILTKRLVLIQGPPGTGKTHVSVVALQVLLSNKIAGEAPIIIAAHTNHALDQLLRLVASYEKSYVRLGGRSKDAEIAQHTLYNIRNSQSRKPKPGSFLTQARKHHQSSSAQMVEIFKPLEAESCNTEPLTASTFVEYRLLTQAQFNSMMEETNASGSKTPVDPFKDWLGDQVGKIEPDYESEKGFLSDDMDWEYERLQEIEAEQGPDSETWEELKGRNISLEPSFRGNREGEKVPGDKIKRYLQCPDMHRIPAKHRGAVYDYLRTRLIHAIRAEVRAMAVVYLDVCKNLRLGKWQRDSEILRQANLIAMTTTGLSKYRGLVASLNPKIVLIEEAAEVIESPVAVACFESIQQLILVGDHKQLQGHCSLHDLAGSPFHLDVSMFERLVGNKMPYVMLREQRRMAPEISQLLEPIYDKLQDHPSVREYPLIPGMGNARTFFFNHNWEETGDSLFSRINEREAAMVARLYAYLVSNGTPSKDITILTFYNGQKKMIISRLKDVSSLQHHAPNVMTVDSYQGEENDIILASLVRNRPSDGIGFLAVDNRVCVALSRAKRGFFLFGSKELLSAKSGLWKQVIAILSTGGPQRIGNAMKLTCQRHGSETEVGVPGDWMLEGSTVGCKVTCGEMLKCGHICPKPCHGFEHTKADCKERCEHVRPCCKERCSNICGEHHNHHCDCAPMVSQALIEHQKIVDDGVQGIKAALRADAQSWKFTPTSSQRGRGFGRGSNTFARRGRIPTTRPMGRASPLGPAPRQTSDLDESQVMSGWIDFANGGARAMDLNLGVLSRAKDLNSEDAQRALAGVDDRFLTKEMLEAKEALGRKKEEAGKKEEDGTKEGVLINFDSDEADPPDPVPRNASPCLLDWGYEETSRIEELADEIKNLSLSEICAIHGESSRIEELDDDAEDLPRIEELDDDEDGDENPEETEAKHTTSGIKVDLLIDFSD